MMLDAGPSLPMAPAVLAPTLPQPTVDSRIPLPTVHVAPSDSAPQIAYDPSDTRRLVAVYAERSGAGDSWIEIAYSTDSGASWGVLTDLGAYAYDSDPGVAYDRSHNFYIVWDSHAGGFTSGEIDISSFAFTGNVPARVISGKPLYQWINYDAAYQPVIAVDNNPDVTPADPVTGLSVEDKVLTSTAPSPVPYARDSVIYVAYTVDNTHGQTGIFPINEPTKSVIRLMASDDQGQTFSTSVIPDDSTIFAGNDVLNAWDSSNPQLAISQGSLDGRVPAGQLNVIWHEEMGTGNNTIQFDHVNNGGRGFWFNDVEGWPAGAIPEGGSQTFTINVNFSDPTAVIADMDVEMRIHHYNDSQVAILLTPPATSGVAPIWLLLPRPPIDPFIPWPHWQGASGVDLGVIGSAPLVFDQDAARPICDITATGPYGAHFQPEIPSSLDGVDGMTGAQLDGAWTLTVYDTVADAVPPFPAYLQDWGLNFTSELTTHTDVTITGGVIGSSPGLPYPTADLVSPDRGVGPGLSIASDNTWGSFSPYEGRLYVAYTTAGKDIAYSYSDDGGTTWHAGGIVNDDNPVLDGYSEGGRTQFEPQVAVDQTTGTVVMTWVDGRNDGSNARVATYISASIDGGTTWSPQTYLNVPNTATDSITQELVDLGPTMTNQSAGNGARDTMFGIGERQGLTVWGGRVHAVFSSNDNGGLFNITSTIATIPSGPRIEASTMGPVSEWTDRINPLQPAGPTFQAFEVDFDRPIDPYWRVNPLSPWVQVGPTFTPADVQVFYRSPDQTGNDPGVLIGVASITPIDLGFFGPALVYAAPGIL